MHGYGNDRSAKKKVLFTFFFCVLPGLFLFALDQLLMNQMEGEFLPLFLSVLYLAPFFILSAVAVAFVSLLNGRCGDERALYILFVAAFSISVLTFILSLIGLLTGTSLTGPAKAAIGLEVVCMALLAAGLLWTRRGGLSGLRLHGLLSAVILIFTAWSVMMPEWLFT